MATKIIEDEQGSLDDLVVRARKDSVIRRIISSKYGKITMGRGLEFLCKHKICHGKITDIDIYSCYLFAGNPGEYSFRLYGINGIEEPNQLETITSPSREGRPVAISVYDNKIGMFFSVGSILYACFLKKGSLDVIHETDVELDNEITSICIRDRLIPENKEISICTSAHINDYAYDFKNRQQFDFWGAHRHEKMRRIALGPYGYKAAASKRHLYSGYNWTILDKESLVKSNELPDSFNEDNPLLINGIAFSHRGYIAIVGGTKIDFEEHSLGFMRVYRIKTKKNDFSYSLELRGEHVCEPLNGVAFAEDGQHLAACNNRGEILWYKVNGKSNN
jgi:hypothetical protein